MRLICCARYLDGVLRQTRQHQARNTGSTFPGSDSCADIRYSNIMVKGIQGGPHTVTWEMYQPEYRFRTTRVGTQVQVWGTGVLMASTGRSTSERADFVPTDDGSEPRSTLTICRGGELTSFRRSLRGEVDPSSYRLLSPRSQQPYHQVWRTHVAQTAVGKLQDDISSASAFTFEALKESSGQYTQIV